MAEVLKKSILLENKFDDIRKWILYSLIFFTLKNRGMICCYVFMITLIISAEIKLDEQVEEFGKI